MVQHFYDFWDGTLCDNIEEADVIVKVHESDDLSDVESLKESKIIFDPWRTHKSDKHEVYQYGNRRSTYDENPFLSKLWYKITTPYRNWKERRRIKKKMEEIKKRDPFIYD